jgi:hypothetical protein
MTFEQRKLTRAERRVKHMRSSTGPEFVVVNRFYYVEMLPIIDNIANKNFDARLKVPLRKYLVILCVSLIEDFMIKRARRMIDEYKIDFSGLVKRDIELLLSEHEQQTKQRLSKGEYILLKHNFANLVEINSVFSNLLKSDPDFNALNMDFIEAVKKIDWYDPYKYIKEARSIFLNWDNFVKMFDVRTEIVHELGDIRFSDSKLFSLCDNTMNFLDATDFICNPEFKQHVIDRLKSDKTLRQRNAILWKKYRI